MMPTRRDILWQSGGFLVSSSFLAIAAEIVDIRMQGRPDGSDVWFDPIGIRIDPGQTIRWTNFDRANAHTTTAYHPSNFDHPRRIPNGAKPWNSDYLLPQEGFSVTFGRPGVYDYYCVPHEHAGMVGRIVVGSPEPPGWAMVEGGTQDLPEVAVRAFPTIENIMQNGMVRRT